THTHTHTHTPTHTHTHTHAETNTHTHIHIVSPPLPQGHKALQTCTPNPLRNTHRTSHFIEPLRSLTGLSVSHTPPPPATQPHTHTHKLTHSLTTPTTVRHG